MHGIPAGFGARRSEVAGPVGAACGDTVERLCQIGLGFGSAPRKLGNPACEPTTTPVILRGVRGQLLSHSRVSSHTSNLVVHGKSG